MRALELPRGGVPAFPPGPPDEFGLKRLFRMSRDPLGFFTQLRRDHGRFVHYRIGPRRVWFVADPELIQDVLVKHAGSFLKDQGLESTKPLLGEGLLTSEGEFHRRQRRLAQPAFHHARIAAYGSTMVKHGLRACARFRDGETLDFVPEMMRLALGIVGKTLFDSDVASDADTVARALGVAMDTFTLARVPFWRLLLYLPVPSTLRFARARRELDEVVTRIIRAHRESGRDRGDLLSMLLLAQDVEGGTGRMNDRQLRDEAMTILLAGHETTAVALAWTFYLLAQHPGVEAALHEELDSVLRGAPPTTEDVKRLPYADMVLSESMRLYPPAWAIGRRAHEPVPLGGYELHPGDAAVLSQWVVHRDPELWPDPLRFDPLRFEPARKAARHRFAYFPFGGGPRVCIGDGFAWLAGTLLLATLAQRWRFELVPDQRVEPLPRVTLRLKHGLRLVARSRPSPAGVLS
jgi:cytochrome P450